MTVFVDKNIAIIRYDICKSCDKLTAIKTCSECGCFMPAKVKFSGSTCPLNKWPNIATTTTQDYNIDD